jgi:RNA polymerase sigma factor (sigma-70 family)
MDREAILKDIAEKHHNLWKKLAYKIVKDAGVTDDVLQESWRKVLSSKANFLGHGDWENYFTRVVINTALDYWKEKVKLSQRVASLEEAFSLSDGKDSQLAEILREEEAQRYQALLREIDLSIQELPDSQREAIALLLLDENPDTLQAISQRQGVAISTLRSRLLGGIKRIQKDLRKKGIL